MPTQTHIKNTKKHIHTKRFRSALLITLVTVNTGCSHWPTTGTGGFAEHSLEAFIAVEAGYPLSYVHGLRFDYELSHNTLNYLIAHGAELCFPAAITQARLLENRIVRELHGELYSDASNNLIVQRTHLTQIEHNLHAVSSQGACTSQANTHNATTTKDTQKNTLKNTTNPTGINTYNVWYENVHNLLNNDNQFAIGSSEINPKYAMRLQQASVLLKDKANIHLIIRGHTDNQGTSQENKNLSYRRAKRVAKMLIENGILTSQITIIGYGDSEPLFSGSVDHIHLVNRRVNVEIMTIAQGELK